MADLDAQLKPLVRRAAPALLVAAGDNRDRLAHERAFARLCGVAPIDASSGRQLTLL